MMERIKKGVHLRKVHSTDKTPLTKNTTQEYNALQELRGLLKSHKDGGLMAFTWATEETELEKVIWHRKERTETDAGSQHKVEGVTAQSTDALSSENKLFRNKFNRIPVRGELSKNVTSKHPASCSISRHKEDN
ncbi:shootin-1-like [Narcine bancroftii]|uniref:shootin-1-like n=1 Tax=Narcine bancroftii TaxID=1343680 RepID=UPI0038321AC5